MRSITAIALVLLLVSCGGRSADPRWDPYAGPLKYSGLAPRTKAKPIPKNFEPCSLGITLAYGNSIWLSIRPMNGDYVLALIDAGDERFRVRGITVDAPWNAWLQRRIRLLIDEVNQDRPPSGGIDAYEDSWRRLIAIEAFFDYDGRQHALSPQGIDRAERGQPLDLRSFLDRLWSAVDAAGDGTIGAAGQDDDGEISERNAPMSVRIGETFQCDLSELKSDRSKLDDCFWPDPFPLCVAMTLTRDRWKLGASDATLALIVAAWELRYSDEDVKCRATYELASRFDPVRDPEFVGDVEWPLLFSLIESGSQGYCWSVDVAELLIENDPQTLDGRILYQWLGLALAYFHREQPQRVERLLRRQVNSPEYSRRSLSAGVLSHLSGSGCISLLRSVRAKYGDHSEKFTLALIHSGAGDEFPGALRWAQALSVNDCRDSHLDYLWSAVGFIPSDAFAADGLPGVDLADRAGLARKIPALVASGAVRQLMPSLAVDDLEFTRWLISQRPVEDMRALGLLARQSNSEAAAYLAELCRTGNTAARSACEQHWNPRFFPAAEVDDFLRWTMDDAAIASADWPALLSAAATGQHTRWSASILGF